MENKEYISIPEAAKLLNLTRQAVYKQVKNKQIYAVRIGRNYAIPVVKLFGKIHKRLDDREKEQISSIVRRIVDEYGEVLRLLGNE